MREEVDAAAGGAEAARDDDRHDERGHGGDDVRLEGEEGCARERVALGRRLAHAPVRRQTRSFEDGPRRARRTARSSTGYRTAPSTLPSCVAEAHDARQPAPPRLQQRVVGVHRAVEQDEHGIAAHRLEAVLAQQAHDLVLGAADLGRADVAAAVAQQVLAQHDVPARPDEHGEVADRPGVGVLVHDVEEHVHRRHGIERPVGQFVAVTAQVELVDRHAGAAAAQALRGGLGEVGALDVARAERPPRVEVEPGARADVEHPRVRPRAHGGADGAARTPRGARRTSSG